MIKYKGKNWIFTVSRNLSFWHQSSSARGYITGMKKFGIPFKAVNAFVTLNGTETHVFYDHDELKNFANIIIEFAKDKKRITELEKSYRKYASDLVLSLDLLKKDISVRNLKSFLKHYTEYCSALMITLFIGRNVSEQLVNHLQTLGFSDIDYIVSIITYPNENTPLTESQKSLIKIGQKINLNDLNSKKTNQKVKKWLERFQHIPVNFCEEPWNEYDAKQMLSDFIKNNSSKQLEFINKSHNNKIKERKNILKRIDDELVENFAYAIAKGTILNEFRKNVFSYVSLNYRPVFKEIAKICGSDNWRDCFYLTVDEMINVVSGRKIHLPSLREKRKIAGCVVDDKGNVRIMKKPLLKKFLSDLPDSLKKVESRKKRTQFEVSGTVANRGIVRGAVKVIKNSAEFGKFKKGDILVATMTSVDFVPIMGIAAAFVTNEGGITSHASIVAREMNKPCIIGTKIATEVFRDGDLVEVDAEKGIVKILERA